VSLVKIQLEVGIANTDDVAIGDNNSGGNGFIV
jgi:hypothetical protein